MTPGPIRTPGSGGSSARIGDGSPRVHVGQSGQFHAELGGAVTLPFLKQSYYYPHVEELVEVSLGKPMILQEKPIVDADKMNSSD